MNVLLSNVEGFFCRLTGILQRSVKTVWKASCWLACRPPIHNVPCLHEKPTRNISIKDTAARMKGKLSSSEEIVKENQTFFSCLISSSFPQLRKITISPPPVFVVFSYSLRSHIPSFLLVNSQ